MYLGLKKSASLHDSFAFDGNRSIKNGVMIVKEKNYVRLFKRKGIYGRTSYSL